VNVVLDTSAAVLVTLQRAGWERLRDFLDSATWVQAPDLLIPEAANALWKEHRFGVLGLEDSEKALGRIVDIPDEVVPSVSLHKEAFALAALTERPAYDMFFLVLARRNSATLLSIDRKLLAFADKHDVKTFPPA
jgi:predicted nucleic acid-binding protein